MSLDIQSHFGAAEDSPYDGDTDLDQIWVENVVTVAVSSLTVLFVSSVAVLMYLA